jgi:hypothetical protein
MPARSFFEALGEGVGRVADAYPTFYELGQRKKRQEAEDLFRRQEADRDQSNWERSFGADEAARLFERTEAERENRIKSQWDMFNMNRQLGLDKMRESETLFNQGISEREIKVREQDAGTRAAKATGGLFTPSQAYENIGQAYNAYSEYQRKNLLGQGDQAVAAWGMKSPTDSSTGFSVEGRKDLVTAIKNVPLTREASDWWNPKTWGSNEPVPGAGQRVDSLQSLLSSFDALGSPTHRTAWTTSPDSIFNYDPNLAGMVGIQPSSPYPANVNPADTLPAVGGSPAWQRWGYESQQAAIDTMTADLNAGLMDTATYNQYMQMLRQ